MLDTAKNKKTIDKKIIGYKVFYDGKLIVNESSHGASKQEANTEHAKKEPTTPSKRKRGKIVHGFTVKLPFEPAGKVYLTMNFSKNELVEVFISATKNNPELSTSLDVLARLISVSLKYGVNVRDIIKHLKGADSGQYVLVHFPGREKGKFIKSIYDLIGTALELYSFDMLKSLYEEESGNALSVGENDKSDGLKEEKLAFEVKQANVAEETAACPECGSTMVSEQGCWTCKVCGYSKCG